MSASRRKSGKEKRRLGERLACDLDSPPELLSGGCFIEIRGRNSVTVYGCRRILRYTEIQILLKMKKNIVTVTGQRLTCLSYLAGAVTVEGWIDGVHFSSEETEKGGGDGASG